MVNDGQNLETLCGFIINEETMKKFVQYCLKKSIISNPGLKNDIKEFIFELDEILEEKDIHLRFMYEKGITLCGIRLSAEKYYDMPSKLFIDYGDINNICIKFENTKIEVKKNLVLLNDILGYDFDDVEIKLFTVLEFT